MFDTVTAALEEFAQKNILSLFDECYDYAWGDTSRLVYPKMDAFRDDPQQIEEVNQRLMKRIQSICENYPLFKLLILSRKVPISVASAFFQKFASTSATQTTGLSLLFTESMLFSTNCVLMYSPNNLTVQAIQDRDEKLVEHVEDIRKRWPNSDIVGAIYVYCTDEAEFIPSFHLDFWFKAGQYPRICLIEELIDFLHNMDLADLLNHPRFVKLSS
jgi:hypothetical protein